MTKQEVLDKMGIHDREIISTTDGEMAVLLDVQGDTATIGLLMPIGKMEVDVSQLISTAEAEARGLVQKRKTRQRKT